MLFPSLVAFDVEFLNSFPVRTIAVLPDELLIVEFVEWARVFKLPGDFVVNNTHYFFVAVDVISLVGHDLNHFERARLHDPNNFVDESFGA